MHATAAPFVPPQYNSFGAEISGPTNKHLAVEEQFHRSASSESLRRTSQGYDYEFSFEPNDEAGVEQAIEDDAATTSDSSHPVEAKKSRARKKSKAAQDVKSEDDVAESNDDATLTEESKAEPEVAQIPAAKDTEVVQEPSVHSNDDASVALIEELPVPAAQIPEVVQESSVDAKEDEAITVAEELALPDVQEEENLTAVPKEEPSAPSAEALPVPASEADMESRTESVFSEAPTEILSDTAADKAPESAARKSAVPAGSIHPFAKAKAKATNAQRQVSKADKKKAKKQGQANKKNTEPVATVITEAPEPEILSLDEIKARSKAKAVPSKLASAAKPELPLTEANVEALSAPVAESSTPVLESGALLSVAEDKIAVSEVTKAEDVASVSTTTATTVPRVPVVAKSVPRVALPRNPSHMKRLPSVTVTADPSHKERKLSTASAASESSFGTPKTAREYQTPAPSPAPDMSSSPPATPVVAETEEGVQATAGAEIEPIADAQPEVEAEAETAEIDKSAPAIQTNKKKNQKKKRQNRQDKKKNASVDGQDNGSVSQSQAEAAPEGILAKLGCTGMDQDSSPNADKATSPELHHDNVTPGTSSDVTGQEEKSSVSSAASTKRSTQENVAGPRSWAQLLAGTGKSSISASVPANIPTKGGLSARDTNVGQQYTKGG